MKNQLCSTSSDEDEYDLAGLPGPHCWWRSAERLEECAKLKLDPPNVSGLTPRLRVLRELERLALVASEGLNELRQKLLTYRSGDFWMPTGGVDKDKTDIPPVVTILLVGFSGSGKSSLINLMYCVLGRSGLVPFAQASSGNCSNYTSMFLEEHNVLRSLRSGFCVYDSRGFDYEQISESLEELSTWMNDGVHHNQLCLRSGDYLLRKEELEVLMSRSSSKFIRRRVNCAMVVANVAEIYKAYKAGNYKPLDAIKELYCSPAFKKCIENPILILTHGDMLSTEERIEGRTKICEWLNISETSGVYDIVCLTEYGFIAEDSDPVSAYALTEAVYRALLISDRTHPPKRSILDWTMLILSWLMCFIAAFFAFLAEICSKLANCSGKLKL
ncbi:P-loop containing nucleoside triphosphate hydrolase [Trema orientale]|uniref:P-loop containing nucleoside triphosphate hydrolase n=1 Tax=Trema orientale TaxID=63057 RepID=A0A2P5DGM7_TREOI|nr:P-loop containing nucleoside triphosphate hydrolase [Trema orientale]